jgi:hypothetical protein
MAARRARMSQLAAAAAARLKKLREQEKLGTADRAEVLKAELDELQRKADVRAIKKKLVELQTGGRGGTS